MNRRAEMGYRIGLIAIVLFGLFLRLWRLDFGEELPYLAHTDEPTQYNPALRIVKSGDLNPHFFNYPSLTIYVDALAMYAGYWAGRLAGAFQSLDDLQPIRTAQMAVGVVGTPAMLLIGRGTTAVVGTLTLGLVYAITRCLVRARWAALLATAMLAVSTLHVRLSHYMTVDVIATFCAVACVAACTKALHAQQRRYLWIAALCGGLATSSKYNYAVLAVPVAAAALLDLRADWGRRLAHAMLCGVLFCAAFLLTSPYVLLDWENSSAGIAREIRHYATGHLGVTGSSFAAYLVYLWQDNPAFLLLGVPGMGVALWRGRRVAVPAAAALLFYYLLVGRQAVHFDRNVLPLLVLLVAGAGVSLGALGTWALEGARRLGAGRPIVVIGGALLCALPLLPSLWRLPAFVIPPGPSGKAQAQAWFDRAIEAPSTERALRGLKIAAESYTVYLDPTAYDVKYYGSVTEEEYGFLAFRTLKYDVVILGSGMYDRFYQNRDVYAEQVSVYDAFFERVPNALAFEGRYDPLDFRGSGGKVYVAFLTRDGSAFLDAVQQGP